ncbi:MAG: alpha/beta fold hydrolase [Peptococcaceae bacterium]|nr:MAG: alpha/beta fold hydrolase [Peptococcaceae bacterium]
MIASMEDQLKNKSGPFFFSGGADACVLAHGFGGTPAEMFELGQYLASRGITVAGVRLPGHDPSAPAPGRVPWREWVGAVEDEAGRLAAAGERVFLCGFSMGGTVSLYLAAGRSDIAGVVTICAPVFLKPTGPLLRGAFKYLFLRDKEDLLDIRDLEARSTHISLPEVPFRWGVELFKLLGAARRRLRDFDRPLLILQAAGDRIVPPANASFIYRSVASNRKEIVWLNNSGHIATRDYDKEAVFAETSRFIGDI